MVDEVDAEIEALAAAAADQVQVAVIDARTAAALGRVGGLPGATLRQPPPDLLDCARRALRAAEALLDAGCDGEALLHLRTAALALLARRTRRAEPPAPEEAARWLHGELVPTGAIDADEAMTVTRTLIFADAPSVPPGLAAAALADLRRMAAGPAAAGRDGEAARPGSAQRM